MVPHAAEKGSEMDFDQYLNARTDLTTRVLLDDAGARPFTTDWRLLAAGSACITAAIALQIWASVNQPDAGYFARTTTFSQFVLLTGLLLISMALGAAFLLARLLISSREATKQKTLRQLLMVDGALARTIATRSDRTDSA
jgi:hypothetical protein